MAQARQVPDLASLEHENWIAYLTGAASCTIRTKVMRTGGVVTLLTGLPMDWYNQILVERDNATRADLLAAVADARDGGEPFAVRLREEIDDRFIPSLVQAGMEAEGRETSTPGMVAFPIDEEVITTHAAPDLEIRVIADAAGIEVHRAGVTAGFGSEPAVADGTACVGLLDRPECTVYVGYADGSPVVTGLGWRTGRTIGVYSIGTIGSARRRGYGAAMTARVMADGVAAGCDAAALQASEMGRPIYERLGFQTVVRYAAYTERIGRPTEARTSPEPMQTMRDLVALEHVDWMEFAGELYYWRGPAPYHFIRVPEEVCIGLRAVSSAVTYGWGMIPVWVRIGGSLWETSLFPKDGGYVLPIKDVPRKAEGLADGDTIAVELAIRS